MTRSSGSSVQTRYLPLVHAVMALLFSLFLLGGCAFMVPSAEEPPAPRPAERPLEQRAAAAWEAGDYSLSMSLYRKLTEQDGLSPDLRALAWERLVGSALEQKQYHLALQSLTRWRTALPEAAQTAAWQSACFRTIKNLGDGGLQETELLALSSDTSLPWEVRTRAGIVLACLQWARGDIHRPQMVLALVQQQAKERGGNSPALIEGMLLDELAPVQLPHLEAFQLLIPEESRSAFPYTIIELEKARRLAQNLMTRNQAYTIVQRVAPFLADPGLAQKVLGKDEPKPGAAQQAVALALPLTGPYAEVAAKVLRGAMAAQKDLSDQGTQVDVQVVNTDGATWQQDLSNLPPEVVVIGGPLRVDIFKQIMNTDLPRRRAFFAFMASLGSAVEGRDAWRFFASAEDQVRVLLRTAVQQFGVQTMAVLFPQESYGMHMAQLFRQETMSNRIAVIASEGYSPRNTEQWGDTAGRVAQSGAGAVFIPGDWDNAELLVPYLLYHNAQDMLVMGPSIWGPSIDRKQYVEMPSFEKTIFPGAWWSENTSPAAVALKQRMQLEGQPMPDFWTALGYDFVQCGALLGKIDEKWTPEDINRRIQQTQSMSWSQAPITWNAGGVATQQLFVFRPTQNGYTRLAPMTEATEPAPASGYALPAGYAAPGASSPQAVQPDRQPLQ